MKREELLHGLRETISELHNVVCPLLDAGQVIDALATLDMTICRLDLIYKALSTKGEGENV